MDPIDVVPLTGEDDLPTEEGVRWAAPVPGGEPMVPPVNQPGDIDVRGEEKAEHHLKTREPSKKTENQLITDLNTSFTDVQTAVPLLTPQFMESSEDVLRTRELEIETLISVYKR